MKIPQKSRTWCEISLDNIEKNFKAIKEAAADGAKICCVIKSNAYGHGAVRLGRLYEQLGADYFAVATLDEAAELREAGITLPILILGYTDPETADILSELDITQTVFSSEYAHSLSRAAKNAGVSVKIHIKADTGMGRIGFICRRESDKEVFLRDVLEVCSLPSLIPEGIFTHFADSPENREYTEKQFSLFNDICNSLAERGIKLIRHCANSAAVFGDKKMHLDMVRPGIVLYGLLPADSLAGKLPVLPAMTLKSSVAQVKEIKASDSVGYGRAFTAERDMKIATVPVGYADGYFRSNASCGSYITINGEKCRVVGRICMDQLTCETNRCKPGDTAVIFGENGISADRLAAKNGTIGYEIVHAVSERVPRVYISNGKITD